MDIEKLAKRAVRALLRSNPRELDHGMELIRDFFVIYNVRTGQSRSVLYHEKSGYVFKLAERWGRVFSDADSNSDLGTVVLDGKTYRMRFPEVYTFEINGELVEVQEFVNGEDHRCLTKNGFQDAWCEHSYAIQEATGLTDTHSGNWKVAGNEVVIFDC